MNFVADTHALLWWFTDSPRISSNASEFFEECEKGESIIVIVQPPARKKHARGTYFVFISGMAQNY